MPKVPSGGTTAGRARRARARADADLQARLRYLILLPIVRLRVVWGDAHARYQEDIVVRTALQDGLSVPQRCGPVAGDR